MSLNDFKLKQVGPEEFKNWKNWLSVSEAAEKLSVTPMSILNWIRAGKIDARDCRGLVLVDVKSIKK